MPHQPPSGAVGGGVRGAVAPRPGRDRGRRQPAPVPGLLCNTPCHHATTGQAWRTARARPVQRSATVAQAHRHPGSI